ncbi:MAG: hypothetical protein HYW91_00405 [Candidatus Sungbacteria bacterium]|nr:hypothetical protein [Candidatus Sungbacteria bacterium]
MTIFIVVTSIIVITISAWVVNKFLPWAVCPICAGVAGTWLWILFGIYTGWLEAEGWKLAAAIAMGGSVVGMAYQAEKFLRPFRSRLLWKTIFISTGFAAVYSLILFWRAGFIIAVVLLTIFTLKFLAWPRARAVKSKKVEELVGKMEDCC